MSIVLADDVNVALVDVDVELSEGEATATEEGWNSGVSLSLPAVEEALLHV